MSLINFHRVLIAAAILFCAGYGAYELPAFAIGGGDGSPAYYGGGGGSPVISGVFFVFAAALTFYLWHLKRFLGVDE